MPMTSEERDLLLDQEPMEMTDLEKLKADICRVLLDAGADVMEAADVLTSAVEAYKWVVNEDFRLRPRASTGFINPSGDKPFTIPDPPPQRAGAIPGRRSGMSADEREVLILLAIEFCQSQRDVPSGETRSRATAEKIAELLKRIEP